MKENGSNIFEPYRNYFVQLLVLETLLLDDNISIENLHLVLISRMDSNDKVSSSTTLPYVRDRVVYLAKLGLIVVDAEADSIKITEKGIDLLRTGTIQNGAVTTFFNYKAFNISFWAFVISIFAALLSLFALFK